MNNRYFISYAYRNSFFKGGFGTVVGLLTFNPLDNISKTAKFIEEQEKVRNVVLINVMEIKP